MTEPEGWEVARTFQAVATAPSHARSFVRAVLSQAGAGSAAIEDLCLVVSELVTNAVRYGDGAPVEVCVDTADDRWWALEVTGGPMSLLRGHGPADSWGTAAPDEPGGRGLGIVRHLAGEIMVWSRGTDAAVRCAVRRSTTDRV